MYNKAQGLLEVKSFTVLGLVQLLSHVWLFETSWTAACQASLSFTISQSLLKLRSIQPSHICRPLLLLPSIFHSIRIFTNESAFHIRWPKYWSFSISSSNEYSGLISFRIDWFDLLAVEETLKSLLQHHGLKASILWHTAFFMVQFSHCTWLLEKPQLWLYGPLSAGWCLFFNTLLGLSAFQGASIFNFMAAVTIHSGWIYEPKKIICHCYHFFPYFECWVLSQLFHSPLSPSSRGSLVPLHFLPLGLVGSNWFLFLCAVSFWNFKKNNGFLLRAGQGNDSEAVALVRQ